ncbi:MAG: PKD domain-containing protein [Polyangiaceae bacterium]|nr:PKD domain-containing protein [Polyangiaceae bacterium]
MRDAYFGELVLAVFSTALLLACGDYYGQEDPFSFKPNVSGNRPPRGTPVIVGITQNQCPELEFAIVAPTNLKIGTHALLFARAVDPEGGTLDYNWSASGGTISAPSEANSTYTCTEPGSFDVHVTVSNGSCDSISGIVPITCE